MAYRKTVGKENLPEINRVDDHKYETRWVITGEDFNEHIISYKGMKFFGNVKLSIDNEKREFEPYIIKRVGWMVSFTVGNKELLLKIPFSEMDIDLAVDGTF